MRLIPRFLRILVRALIGMGKQLCYLGYYNDPRTFASVGYVPFSQRPDTKEKLSKSPSPAGRPLRVLTASDVTGETLDADVVVIGTGAGASILAHGIAKSGRGVLMIERGNYFDPSTFTEDEAQMLGRLYADGALQLTRAFDFQVIQGSCVGGSTVVNNAVCFDLPDRVRDRWNDAPLRAGLDPARLDASFRYVRELVGVERQPLKSLNPSGEPLFGGGIRALRLDKPPNEYRIVEANIHDCLGCGYCNIGCRYGRKLSMLDRVLPDAQATRRAGRPEDRGGLRGREAPRDRPPDHLRHVPVHGRPPDRRPRKGLRRGGGSDLVEPPSRAVRSRRARRRQERVLQHGLADQRALRRCRGRLRGSPDLPLSRGRARRRVCAGDLVQPPDGAVALHARMVRGPLPQHAPIQPHGCDRRPGGDRVERRGLGRGFDRPRHLLRAHAGRPPEAAQGPGARRPDLSRGRRPRRHAEHVPVLRVQERERARAAAGFHPRFLRHDPGHRPPAGGQRRESRLEAGQSWTRSFAFMATTTCSSAMPASSRAASASTPSSP